MCVHKRTLYAGCMCSDWGVKVQSCKVEMDFLSGELACSCVTRWSHGLHTRKIDAVCPDCSRRRNRTDKTLEDVKEVLRNLRENVEGRLDAPISEQIAERADQLAGEQATQLISKAGGPEAETKCDSEGASTSSEGGSDDSSSTISIPQWRTRHHLAVAAPAPSSTHRLRTRESEAVYMYVHT